MKDDVILLDLWASPYGMRVKIVLHEKGIEYECREENLEDKSSLLLQSNPVHKMIPVLVHNGKPIFESLIIVEYIDEVWHDISPLLPSDPYYRSQAKYWADYIDKKIYSIAKRAWVKGEDQEVAKKELIECFKTLEGLLDHKPYFGGDGFGFVDVALVPLTSWFYTLETEGGFSIEAVCPKLVSWAKRCLNEKLSVSKALPHPHKIYDYALGFLRKDAAVTK